MSKTTGTGRPRAVKLPDFDPASIRMCTDRVTDEDQSEVFAKHAIEEDVTNVIPGLSPALGIARLMPARIGLVTGKKWATGRTIGIAFLGGSNQQQTFVVDTIESNCKHINLPLRWGVSPNESDCRIGFDRNLGSWSFIGTDNKGIPKNAPTMNFGWDDAGTILHEFHHLFGCIHEHQQPAAKIPWNLPAVYRFFGGPPNNWNKKTIDSNVISVYSDAVTQFTTFDRTSIMLYPIDKALVLDPSFATGWNATLSASDVAFLSELYPLDTIQPAGESRPAACVLLDKAGKEIARASF